MALDIEKIKTLRARQRMSQSELAKVSGVPESTIAAIETGRSKNPGYPTMKALAMVLQEDIDNLYLPGTLNILSNKSSEGLAS